MRGNNSLALQLGDNCFVMHEVTKDGGRSCLRLLERQLNGVANAKAHADMLGPKNTHVRLQVIAYNVYFVSQRKCEAQGDTRSTTTSCWIAFSSTLRKALRILVSVAP